MTPADPTPASDASALGLAAVVTPTELIAQVRGARARREQADRDVIALALAWATSHEAQGPLPAESVGTAGPESGDFLAAPLPAEAPDAGSPDAETEVLAEDIERTDARRHWRGLPVLAWDATAPFAAALGMTTRGGSTVLRHALTLAHRLPRTHACWVDHRVETKPARQVADAVAGQPDDVCAWVDLRVAARIQKLRVIGPVVLDRLINQALLELHTEELELQRQEQLQARYAKILGDPEGPLATAGPSRLGLAEFVIRGDWPDVKAFNDTIAALAEAIRRSDRPDACEPLDARRSIAVGILADPAGALALLDPGTDPSTDPDTSHAAEPTARPKARRQHKILLTCHLAVDAVNGRLVAGRESVSVDADGKAWVDSMIREWAGRDDTTVSVRPVIHCGGCTECQSVCDAHTAPDARHTYRPTDLDKELLALRQPRCVFPFCSTPARRADCDHLVPFDPVNPGATPTCPRCNLAPLCRHHHRLKTHAGWRYRQVEPGVYTWAEPHRQRFVTTRHGTTDTTDQSDPRAGVSLSRGAG